ncbi:hypothetical protein FDP41_002682 [Naegleria fowleri]|uniref:Uncharacterized protein n=1 Tax=Naegleria fowleri TaxID=5763 RepID=A0A6A5BM99_NAEFO|nr:uncharacterized protein FDP41_002682 [Naegleria fowleri]KAF0978167.1 hypothetical protein FDP41_002682 [Naegleria fowleri]CAG4713130.1 unnamed protein product [Naegleria fowleri]
MGQRKTKNTSTCCDTTPSYKEEKGPFRRIAVVGSQRNGKTTLVRSFQELSLSKEEFKKVLQESLACVLTLVMEGLSSDDLSKILNHDDVIQSTPLKQILMNKSTITSHCSEHLISIAQLEDLRTLVMWFWKSSHVQEMVFEWNPERVPPENIALLIQKMTRNEIQFNPSHYVSDSTSGIYEYKFMRNDLQYSTFDLGGDRYTRRRWLHCFENIDCFIVVASLTDFAESYDDRITKIEDSLAYYDMLIDSKWTCDNRIVLVLTKADIFVQRLRNARIKYNGAMDSIIRKELECVDNDCQQRMILNSIISEYYKNFNTK